MNTSNQQDKIPYRNEQAKRGFFEHLRGAKGFSESSVNDYADAIGQWQVFSDGEDFATFNKSKAAAYCEWLIRKTTKTPDGKLKPATRYHYLRRIKEFFVWLASQPEYSQKLVKSDADFLRISKKDMQIVLSGTTKAMPTLEEVQAIIGSIAPTNEIAMRDRALISFALITGCRISAIISLKMKSFDKATRRIHQNPADGVRTKNSKTIITTFFPIGWDEPSRYFLEWYEYLEGNGFAPDDPIFPATSSEVGTKKAYSKDSIGRSFWSDTGSARKIFEKRSENAGVKYYHPHSYRHLVVSLMSKMRLTEEEKRAISLTLGHENIGTTFGSYGYGSMGVERAVDIVRELRDFQNSEGTVELPDEVRAYLRRLLGDK
jgi:integrase/recombinase XerD